MMRQIRLLTIVSLQGMFGLNEIRHTKDRARRSGIALWDFCG